MCIIKNTPKHMLLNYKLMIEIFGFIGMGDDCIHDHTIWRPVEDSTYDKLTFYTFRDKYILRAISGLITKVLIITKNFNDIIKYMDVNYPNAIIDQIHIIQFKFVD